MRCPSRARPPARFRVPQRGSGRRARVRTPWANSQPHPGTVFGRYRDAASVGCQSRVGAWGGRREVRGGCPLQRRRRHRPPLPALCAPHIPPLPLALHSGRISDAHGFSSPFFSSPHPRPWKKQAPQTHPEARIELSSDLTNHPPPPQKQGLLKNQDDQNLANSI